MFAEMPAGTAFQHSLII